MQNVSIIRILYGIVTAISQIVHGWCHRDAQDKPGVVFDLLKKLKIGFNHLYPKVHMGEFS